MTRTEGPRERPGPPRLALFGAAGLMTLAIGAAGLSVGSTAGAAIPGGSTDAVASSASLRFLDAEDGGVIVRSADTERTVARIPPGDGVFIRGALRAFARERHTRGIGPEAPLRLARTAAGRLTLSDPSTGVTVDLDAFGPTNAASFARLLDPRRP